MPKAAILRVNTDTPPRIFRRCRRQCSRSAALEKKAEDVILLDISSNSTADFFVIRTAAQIRTRAVRIQ